MALDAAVAGESANSYTDVSYADKYFSERLHSELWVLEPAVKEAALITSTRLLDRYMDWAGYKYNLGQALCWPRGGVLNRDGYFYPSTIIPEQIKQATCELAYAILSEDRTQEDSMKGISSLTLGELTITSDKYHRKHPLPETVTALLRGLGALFTQISHTELDRG